MAFKICLHAKSKYMHTKEMAEAMKQQCETKWMDKDPRLNANKRKEMPSYTLKFVLSKK